MYSGSIKVTVKPEHAEEVRLAGERLCRQLVLADFKSDSESIMLLYGFFIGIGVDMTEIKNSISKL